MAKLIRLLTPVIVSLLDTVEEVSQKFREKNSGFEHQDKKSVTRSMRYTAMILLKSLFNIPFENEKTGFNRSYKEVTEIIQSLKAHRKKKFFDAYVKIGNGWLEKSDFTYTKRQLKRQGKSIDKSKLSVEEINEFNTIESRLKELKEKIQS